MPEALALRHVPFEDLGLLEPVLRDRGFRVGTVDVPVADLGAVDAVSPDLLVVLGGPIGAYEDQSYPFLAGELALARARLEAGRPTLGVCLGSQILARALGAKVYPGTAGKEIGWAPISLSEAGRASCLAELDGVPVLHWHGDTFDLPDGAVRLASTDAYENQAFSYQQTLALQFHLEACGPPLERWLVGHAHEIAHTEGLSVAGLRADTASCSPVLEPLGRACFEAWLASVGL